MGELLIFQSLWGMDGLPGEKANWSIEEKIDAALDAGFDGIPLEVPDFETAWIGAEVLRDRGKPWSLECFPKTVEDLTFAIDAIHEFGPEHCDHINLQANVRPHTVLECIPLVLGWQKLAEEAGLKLYVETHHHWDHVVEPTAIAGRFGVPVLGHEETAKLLGGVVDETFTDGDVIETGGLRIEVMHTPGHCADHCAFSFNGTDVLTADALFRGTVGGTRVPGATGFEDLKGSIMDRLMKLPPATRIHPGHREPSTIGEEWEQNPFIRIWRGLDEETAATRPGSGSPTAPTRSSAARRCGGQTARRAAMRQQEAERPRGDHSFVRKDVCERGLRHRRTLYRPEGQLLRGGLPGRLHPPDPGRARLRQRRAAYIDPDECIDCDACVEACPVDACFAEDQLPNGWSEYARVNAQYFAAGERWAMGIDRTPAVDLCFGWLTYGPTEGDGGGGLPPGTAVEEIPDTGFCPPSRRPKARRQPGAMTVYSVHQGHPIGSVTRRREA